MTLQALTSTACRGANQTVWSVYKCIPLLLPRLQITSKAVLWGTATRRKLCLGTSQHTMDRPHHTWTQEHPNIRVGVINLHHLGSPRVALFGVGLNILPWLCLPEKHLPWLVGAGKLATTLLKKALLKISPALGGKSTDFTILTASGLGCAWTQHSHSSSCLQHVWCRRGTDLALQ